MRSFSSPFMLVLLTLCTLGPVSAAKGAPQPNVVIIYADDK